MDGVNFEQIEEGGLEVWLAGLREELVSKTYRPDPVRRVMILKIGGGERALGIPTWASYCTSHSLSLGNAGGSGNPLFQLAVSAVGDSNRVGRSWLSLVS